MDYHFQGQLMAADSKRHLLHTFEVPPGTQQLNLRLEYAPAGINDLRNMLCLSLFDPAGARGAGHRGGALHVVHVSEHHATPGYRAGPLLPGPWMVEIDTHMVLPGEICTYQLTVACETAAPPAAEPAPNPVIPAPRAAATGPGWFRGDLHAHSVHSDARWQIGELIAAAALSGLDFMALTDHNTVSGLDEAQRLCPPGLLCLPGMELTTFWGHALSLGLRDWFDWRTGLEGVTMPEAQRQITRAGGLYIIAHPGHQGDPYCTGCDWRYTDMLPGEARLVEVWNGHWGEGNERSLRLWFSWLNQGHRLVATAGSDSHGPGEDLQGPVGRNVVYAEQLSAEAVLGAIRQGRLYLSIGPHLELHAQTPAGEPVVMGGTARAAEADVSVDWDACPAGSRLRVFADGEPLAEWEPGEHGRRVLSLAAGQARWCVAELRGAQGQMLALTNPIYLKPETGAGR